MRFETLEFVKRAEMRVFVIQTNHKTNSNLVIIQMIEERPAIGFRIERPANRMLNGAFLVNGRVNLPQFLDANAIGLRVGIFPQIELSDQLFGQ